MTRPEISDTSGEGTVCSVDGAVVHVKRREARGGVPAFEYVIGTDETGPVAVRLRQSLPETVDPESVGFPPACENDWRLDDATLVFEAPVEPSEPVRTAWGVDREEHPPIGPPDIDVVPFDTPGAPPDDPENGGDTSAQDADAAPTGAEGDSSDATPDVDGTGDDESAPTFDLSDPPEGLDAETPAAPGSDSGGEDAAAPASASSDDIDAPEVGSSSSDLEAPGSREATEGPGPTDDPVSGAGSAAAEADLESPSATGSEGDAAPELGAVADDAPLVERLVAELESEELDDEHREALHDAFAVRLSDSTNAFVEHLQEKLERRAERLTEEIESLEESVERVYGVKADASEVDAVKRGLTELDDAKVGQSELRELREGHEELAERTATTAEALTALRERHEELAGDAASESELAALGEDLEALQEHAAAAERVTEIADTVEELRADFDTLRETAATESDAERLAERVDELGRRHEELAETAAEAEELETLRNSHRSRLNETRSDLATLRERVETAYSSDAEISTELDRRLQRSLGTLVLFGIGSTGLLSTLPLALAGSSGAAVTFVGGAVALSVWWYVLGSAGGAPGPSSPRDLLE